jgi:hypothetical protein
MVKFLRRMYNDAGQAGPALTDLESSIAQAISELDKEKRRNWKQRTYLGLTANIQVGDAVVCAVNGAIMFPASNPGNAGGEILVATGLGVTSVVLTPTSGTINGGATYTMNTASRKRVFYSTGIEWVTDG